MTYCTNVVECTALYIKFWLTIGSQRVFCRLRPQVAGFVINALCCYKLTSYFHLQSNLCRVDHGLTNSPLEINTTIGDNRKRFFKRHIMSAIPSSVPTDRPPATILPNVKHEENRVIISFASLLRFSLLLNYYPIVYFFFCFWL